MAVSFLLRIIEFSREILTLREFRNCSTFRQHLTWKQTKKIRFLLTRKMIDEYAEKTMKMLGNPRKLFSGISSMQMNINICIFPFPASYIKRPQVAQKRRMQFVWGFCNNLCLLLIHQLCQIWLDGWWELLIEVTKKKKSSFKNLAPDSHASG